MPILFDPADKRVRVILEKAKASGTITDEELRQIQRPTNRVSFKDLEDTSIALAAMGIEVVAPVPTEEEVAASDASFLAAMRARGARGLPLPQLNVDGWNTLVRALERETDLKASRQKSK